MVREAAAAIRSLTWFYGQKRREEKDYLCTNTRIFLPTLNAKLLRVCFITGRSRQPACVNLSAVLVCCVLAPSTSEWPRKSPGFLQGSPHNYVQIIGLDHPIVRIIAIQ
jgi:hypothetical protein